MKSKSYSHCLLIATKEHLIQKPVEPVFLGSTKRISSQLSGCSQEGGGYGDVCIHIADSLCYTAETNTTL